MYLNYIKQISKAIKKEKKLAQNSAMFQSNKLVFKKNVSIKVEL